MSAPLISLLVTEPLRDGTQDVITEIPLDARISSSYSFSSQITSFPVEAGATITDHVHQQPDVITLEGLVSDTPIVEVPTTVRLRGDDRQVASGSYSQAAFDALWAVWRKALPLTVITEYLVYEDMIIEQFEIPRSGDRGEGLWFSMTLRKIATVATLAATLPPDVVARLKRRRNKTKQKKTATEIKLGKYSSQTAAQAALGKVSTTEPDTATQTKATTAAGQHRSAA